MSSKKKPVTTPLHLLQQLSHSLLEHLQDACSAAQADAEKLLAKLEKQRGKAQDKLHDARGKLEAAAAAGKQKAQSKARAAIDELETLLESLQQRQADTRHYILQLKRDAEDSLKLAQGVGKVRDAAAKALGAREVAARQVSASAAKPAAKPKTARRPAASTSKTVSKTPAGQAAPRKPAASKAVVAKPAARKPATRQPAAKPAAAPASKAADAPPVS